MRGYVKDKVYYKYERESGKLRIGGGSWTINMREIVPDKIDLIVYNTDYASYRIGMNEALQKGFLRKFKGEDKLVVPIKNWEVTFKKGATDGRTDSTTSGSGISHSANTATP